MNDELVISNPKISKANKNFYKEVTGYSNKIVDSIFDYLRGLAKSEICLFKQFWLIIGLRTTFSKLSRKSARMLSKMTVIEEISKPNDNGLKPNEAIINKQDKSVYKTPATIKGL